MAALLATFAAAAPARADDPAGTIAGTITDNGSPVSNASVYVHSADGSSGSSAVTGLDGRYEVSNLPVAGSPYRVSIYAPGHVYQYAHGKTDWDSATLFPVTADQVTTVDEALLPTGTISGRFTDPAGDGVSASVTVHDSQGSATGTATDADGNYSISVPPGTYLVSFGYGDTYQYAYGTRLREQAAGFTVAAGETVTVNDVKLATGTIGGRLTNADGSPAAGVSVTADGDGTFGTGSTDQSGAYQIENLVPGSYRVYFELPSGALQWAHQALSRQQARLFTVTSGELTTVDEQLLPMGSIAGRFTDASGVPMASVAVMVDDNAGRYFSATTDADGAYRIDGVLAGTYQVRFYDSQSKLDQYAYGKTSRQAADPIAVVAGQTTRVDDRRLPTGTIRVTAKDGRTGAAISSFYAWVGDRIVSTTNGSLVLPDVAVGTYTLGGGGDEHFLAGEGPTVTVVAGQEAEAELTLQPYGKITTTIVDRAGGAPVGNACVFASKVNTFTFELGCDGRSDSTGAVTLRVKNPGAYNVFVTPERGSPYGAQWVGATGGTGTQDTASRVEVAAGDTASLATVQLDPRGTITGTVTAANGDPVSNGLVGIVAPNVITGDEYYSPIAEDGRYTIDWLGPYRWPLFFKADDHPYQWSGGVGNRLTARPVPVRAGGTTNFDYRMQVGATLHVALPGTTGAGRVVVRNAVTADPVGIVGIGSAEALVPVIGGQRVKVEFVGATTRWYGGTDFASATAVWIPASGTVEITFPTS